MSMYECKICRDLVYDPETGQCLGVETERGNFCDEHATYYLFELITESIKICPHIGEFEHLKGEGHFSNRVITCREDERNVPQEDKQIAIFIPGICIYIYPNGTWSAQGDGDN